MHGLGHCMFKLNSGDQGAGKFVGGKVEIEEMGCLTLGGNSKGRYKTYFVVPKGILLRRMSKRLWYHQRRHGRMIAS